MCGKPTNACTRIDFGADLRLKFDCLKCADRAAAECASTAAHAVQHFSGSLNSLIRRRPTDPDRAAHFFRLPEFRRPRPKPRRNRHRARGAISGRLDIIQAA